MYERCPRKFHVKNEDGSKGKADYKMKIIIVIAAFFHVLMVVGFLDFIPTWKKMSNGSISS
ncbi:hypothetical protein LEP1GSC038_4149 [Leptospira weilii str. 2006001855]|uniref:Uncharacterized protein n=1 Tax=Leptospira weilii str. 2006001855 TaxID=996804 RepID=M6FMJ8_9LEPT|nr:hypothetical protein LEP1GSC038_4149 [Leptospira weilii str. 2006001855]